MAINFTVESGTGSSTSTSYISVEELDQAILDNGLDVIFTDESEKKQYLNRASMVLDSFTEWPGIRLNDDQALEWPRESAYYTDGKLISNSIIPNEIKKALAFMAYYMKTGVDVAPVREGASVKSESSAISGAVSESKEYWYSGNITPEITEIKMILRRLIRPFSMSLQR